MDWTKIGMEILSGGAWTALLITAILIPLMVILEFMKETKVLDRVARWGGPVMKWFRLPQDAAYPLLAGVLFGVCFGSGLIWAWTRQGKLGSGDLLAIGLFLAVCHGMIEDPLLFASVGAHWWLIFLVRLVIGGLILLLVGRILPSGRWAGSEASTRRNGQS